MRRDYERMQNGPQGSRYAPALWTTERIAKRIRRLRVRYHRDHVGRLLRR